MSKELEKEIRDLIDKYDDIKDKMLDYTQEYHDVMYWDIVGWNDSFDSWDVDEIDVKTLRAIVDGHEKLLAALTSIENIGYTYC